MYFGPIKYEPILIFPAHYQAIYVLMFIRSCECSFLAYLCSPIKRIFLQKKTKNYLVGNKIFLPLQSFRRKAGSEEIGEEEKKHNDCEAHKRVRVRHNCQKGFSSVKIREFFEMYYEA